MNGSFLILLVASVLVSGSWHRGEALQPERQDDDDGSGGTRGRRSVRLIMPGTRWCGTGNVSSADGQSYGNIVATDRCCQQHDRCAHTIGAFSMKYGLFNYRFHTISHCECDDVFRSCLRTVGSEEARMVGQVFFNVIGTKCFVLRVQRESQCVERAWWGRCLREEMANNQYTELRGPLSF